MPTAKKLPSGSWRCRVFSHWDIGPDGKKKRVYESFTVKDPSKRGKKECERLASEWSVKQIERSAASKTVQETVREYIDLTSLPPRNIRRMSSVMMKYRL